MGKGNTIILHIEAKERKKECPKCGHRQLVKNGFRVRDFIGLPIGGKKVIIRRKSNAISARIRIVIIPSRISIRVILNTITRLPPLKE